MSEHEVRPDARAGVAVVTLWLAFLFLDEDPGSAAVTATLRDEADRPAGVLALWEGGHRPHPAAVQADPRLCDPDGPACVLVVAMAPATARPIADDPAVVHARRRVLRDARPCAVSTLTADPVHVAGALSVARADRPDQVAALRDDPFSALWPARQLQVGAGVLGAPVRAIGPSLERYGGRPWPYDRFASS